MYRRRVDDVVGYTADADVWCAACADGAYGPGVMRSDSEGNLIQPIFLSDVYQWDEGCEPHCNKCGEGVFA